MPSHPPNSKQNQPYPHALIYPPFPEPGTPATPHFDIKSFVRNIFRANPLFLRFCIETVLTKAPNSKQAKLFAKSYRYENSNQTNRGISMPVHSNIRTCTHIKVSGVRCGSPALRGEQFCYFHQRLIRGVAMPPRPRLNPMAMIEDEESIQVALMEVINNLVCGTMELKRAELIIRALHVATKNIARTKIGIHASDMVREVPKYRDPRPVAPAPPIAPPIAPTKEELAAVIAAHTYPARVQTSDAKTTHVGTDAFVRPGGPAAPVRSTVRSTTAKPTSEYEAALAAVPAAPPQRKPSSSVKHPLNDPAAPKGRKNAAHGASRG